ncbi:MAG: hypothetical protein H7311_03355 [Ramlibacter sp.]|nr:hypothetical protein [Cryobacterium sp.]
MSRSRRTDPPASELRGRVPATAASESLAAPLAAALGVGAAAGGLARLLSAVLPEPWGTLANTSALWGLVPFVASLAVRAPRSASILVGITALVAMVATWVLLAPQPVTPRELLLWGVVGVGAGALCGLAGELARRDSPWARRLAVTIMAGLVVGEGLYGILLIGGPQWWFEAAVGVALALALGRTGRDRMLGLAGALLAAGALYAAYLFYDAIAAG